MSKKVIGFLNLYDSPNLGPLTKTRTLASTSFLGRFAVMDFPLSCFTNSKIDNINILVKDNIRSVAKHIGSLKTWVNNTKIGRQNILVNEKGLRDPKENTDVECLLNNDWVLYEAKADIVVIMPAHIVTQMDLRPIINEHIESGAEITMVYARIKNANEAFTTSNIVKIKDQKVIGLKLNSKRVKENNVSLETYIINTSTLYEMLHKKNYVQLKSIKKIVEALVMEGKKNIFGYEYKGYCRCFDTFEHFVDYSFELLNYDVSKELYGPTKDKSWPIITLTHNSQPTLYGQFSKVKNSFIANGAKINGTVENSILGRNVIVEKGAVVKNSIILFGTKISSGAKVSYAMIDKYCSLEQKAIIEGKKEQLVYIPQGKIVK